MGLISKSVSYEPTMPSWDHIFQRKGRVFQTPHGDMSRILEELYNRGAKRILDLGCGTGRHVVYFARQGFEVFGFDTSPTAVELTKEWLANAGLNAEIRKHRMEHPFPYQDGFFDCVISVQVIHHNLIQNIIDTVDEINRVTSSKALLFVTVPVLKDKAEEGDWELKKIGDRTYLPMNGPEEGIPHHYFTEEGLIQTFSSFRPLDLYIDSTGHRCFLAEKR